MNKLTLLMLLSSTTVLATCDDNEDVKEATKMYDEIKDNDTEEMKPRKVWREKALKMTKFACELGALYESCNYNKILKRKMGY